MKLIHRDFAAGTEKEVTEAEAFELLTAQYGDDARHHLAGLISGEAKTSSVGDGGIFADA